MMESALIKPSLPSYTAISPATKAPQATPVAAQTDLPIRQAVAPASKTVAGTRTADNGVASSANSFETDKQATADKKLKQDQSPLERRNVLDPKSKDVLYRVTNRETGQIVQQLPSESLLRLRAYVKTMLEEAKKPPEPQKEFSV